MVPENVVVQESKGIVEKWQFPAAWWLAEAGRFTGRGSLMQQKNAASWRFALVNPNMFTRNEGLLKAVVYQKLCLPEMMVHQTLPSDSLDSAVHWKQPLADICWFNCSFFNTV